MSTVHVGAGGLARRPRVCVYCTCRSRWTGKTDRGFVSTVGAGGLARLTEGLCLL